MFDHNEMEYRKTINVDFEYKITVTEFRKWLRDTNNEKEFFEKLLKIQKMEIDDYYLFAWDYNIPIIMVKYFRKK